MENVAAEPLKGQRPTAIILGIVGLAELALLARNTTWATGTMSSGGAADGPGSNVEKLGRSLFSTYLLPFEVTSVLLVIAVVGAVVLARRPAHLTAEEQLAAEEEDAAEEARAAGDEMTSR